MSELKLETYSMPSASLSKTPNPLPKLVPLRATPWPAKATKGIIGDDDKYYNYGCPAPLLPYLEQDKYDRSYKPRNFKSVVLENEFLKAVFLPEVGGKLWSLYHKPTKRELLYVNPVYQPVNFAYRNAWTSGGIEWNMGMPAHNPFTCDNVFCGVLKDGDTPVLRIYEWERVRNAPFQIDFYLPQSSPVLFARAKLFNPHDYEIPAYWFTNIAVAEQPGARFLAPSDYAYTFDYDTKVSGRGVKGEPMPYYNNKDVSYPTNLDYATDFFYRIDAEKQMPWVTSLDKDGKGLFEASTKILKGRKIFLWGMNQGGRRWQDFLTEPGNPYIEIQAGLGRTQVECIPMAANSQLEWLECFGLIECNQNTVHGNDWSKACFEVENNIKLQIDSQLLDEELMRTDKMSTSPPEKIIHFGSGWGALEQILMGKTVSPSMVFDNSTLGKEQELWQKLLETGEINCTLADEAPISYITSPKWQALLEKAIAKDKASHWLGWYYLGIMRYVNADKQGAVEAWQTSIGLTENMWSYWALAQHYSIESNESLTIKMLQKAASINKLPELLVEYCKTLTEVGSADELGRVLSYFTDEDKNLPRVQLARAKYLYLLGNYDKSEEILNNLVLPDIRENATVITDLWFDIQAAKRSKLNQTDFETELQYVRTNLSMPKDIDFRMH